MQSGNKLLPFVHRLQLLLYKKCMTTGTCFLFCCCCYLHYRWSLFKPLNVNFHSFDIRNWPILNVKQFTLIQILNTNAFFDEIWRWYLSHPRSYVIWSLPKTIVGAIKFKFHWEYSGWSSPLSVFPLPLFITITYYVKTKKPVMNDICLMTVWLFKESYSSPILTQNHDQIYYLIHSCHYQHHHHYHQHHWSSSSSSSNLL